MKKFFCALLAFIVILPMTLPAVAAGYTPPFSVNAESYYMANLDSSMIISERDALTPVEPGELAQLMTLILAFEKIENRENTLISMRGYIQDELSAQNAKYGRINLGGLYRGEELSADDLIHAVILQSANEAAMMLADYMGDGSTLYFVEMMNHRAKEIGAQNTHFTNPCGLPDDKSYTTAYDMYLIARHALTLPGFEELLTLSSHNSGPTSKQSNILWISNNRLLQKTGEYYNPAVTAVKVAQNPASGHSSVISIAKKNGYTYMLAALNCHNPADNTKAANKSTAFAETNTLYRWAFDTFRVKTLIEKGKSFQEVPLKLCWGKDFLRLMSADSFTALIPDDIEASSVKYELMLPAAVKAPVAKGQLVGEVKLVLSDKVVGRVGVVAAEEAAASRVLMLMDKAASVVAGYWFKFAVIFTLLGTAVYLSVAVVRNRSRRRYRSDTKRK